MKKWEPSKLFYDFEVYESFWRVLFLDENFQEFNFDSDVSTQRDLFKFIEQHSIDVWIGMNNTGYDIYIIEAILQGLNPMRISESIIKSKTPAWKAISLKYTKNIIQFDCLRAIPDRSMSLKKLEGNYGLNIQESSVPWDKQELSEQDKIETKEYNYNDVFSTKKIFEMSKELQASYYSRLILMEKFGLNPQAMSWTDQKVAATIMEAKRVPGIEMQRIEGTEILDKDYLPYPPNLELGKYKHTFNKFQELIAKGQFELVKFDAEICGVVHQFATGGLHGARKNVLFEGLIDDVDETSAYPHLMMLYDLQSRGIANKNKLKEIYEMRLDAKRKGQAGDVEAAALSDALKRVINILFGAQGSKYSELYDLGNQRRICIYGQLFLVDLIDKLEPYIQTLYQSNTDGVFYSFEQKDNEKIEAVFKEWSERTGIPLERNPGSYLVQKDVNNYLYVGENSKTSVKGGYLTFNPIKNGNFKIVIDCVVEFLKNETPWISKLKDKNNSLIGYQIIAAAGHTYDAVFWKVGDKMIPVQRVNRVFATTDETFGKLYKQKADKKTYEMIANLPEHCLIFNNEILDLKLSDYPDLDLNYYHEQIKSKINDFLVL